MSSDVDEFMELVGTNAMPRYHYYYTDQDLQLVLYEDRKQELPSTKWQKMWKRGSPNTVLKLIHKLETEGKIKVIVHHEDS